MAPTIPHTAAIIALVSWFTVAFGVVALALGYPATALVTWLFSGLYLVPVVLAKRYGQPTLAGHLFAFLGVIHVTFAVMGTGGVVSLATITALLVPVSVSLTIGSTAGWGWFFVQIAALIGLCLIDRDRSANAWAAIALVVLTGGLIQAAMTTITAERHKIQSALDASFDALENKVQARTVELQVEVQQRRVAERRAEQANQAKTAFLMNMSHELRTPLNAVQGYAELLTEEAEERGDPTWELGQITAASRHLLSLIDNILEYARLEEGQLSIEPDEIDMVALLESTAQLMQPALRSRNNRLRLDLPDTGPLVAWGDAGWVRQIVINLVANANKYTDEGEIIVQADVDRDGVQVAVRDAGSGIAPDLLPHIFERFTRGQSDRASGTGLGLTISRELAVRMGGTLTASSELGKGSTFLLRLPYFADGVLEASRTG